MPSVYYCDGCNKRMELAEEQASMNVAVEWATGSPEVAKRLGWPQALVEKFCPVCLEHASDYWTAKASVLEKTWKQFNASVSNHKGSFFAARRKDLKVV